MSLEMFSFSSSASDLMSDGYSGGYIPAGYGGHHAGGHHHYHHHHHHQDVSYQHSTGYTAEEGISVASSRQQHPASSTFAACRSPTQQSWAGSLGSPGSPRLLTELGPGSGGGGDQQQQPQHQQLTGLGGYAADDIKIEIDQ